MRPDDHGPRCQCGKVRYLTKREAKNAARRIHPSERMHAYRCDDYWHLGHLPAALIRGEFDRRAMEAK